MRGHSFHKEIDIDFLINISNILLRERRYFILLRISKIVTIILQRVSTVYNIYSWKLFAKNSRKRKNWNFVNRVKNFLWPILGGTMDRDSTFVPKME